MRPIRQVLQEFYDKHETNDNPIILDDYLSGSYAEYHAKNPSNQRFYYYMPDEDRLHVPRCDYVLLADTPSINPRFIELKGGDYSRKKGCCKTEWGHAFHQLYCTYDEITRYIDPAEPIVFVLCTSLNRPPAARYKSYPWYKKLQNLSHEIVVMYDSDIDTFI